MKLSVLEIKENEDGTKSVVLDYDDEMLEIVKKELGNENPSNEEVNDFLLKVLAAEVSRRQELAKQDSDSPPEQ